MKDHNTSIRFDKEVWEALKKKAKEEDRSVTYIIKRFVSSGLTKSPKKR